MPKIIFIGRMRASDIGLRWLLGLISPLLGALGPIAEASSLELTESAALARALTRPAYLELEKGRIAVAESVVAEAALRPNPVGLVEREGVSTSSGGAAETTVQISQTFDIAGRRALSREAAERRLDATHAQQRERRLTTVAEVRRAFADVLHREYAKSASAGWLARLEAAYQTVRRLSQAGDVSGYDQRRLAREVQIASVRLASANAELRRAHELLAGLTGITADTEFKVIGTLPPQEPQPLEILRGKVQERPDLEALRAQAAAFERDRVAADRAWVPDLTLGVGGKHVEERNRSDDRLILSLSVPLPVFDRGRAQHAKALAQAQSLHAEHSLLLSRVEADLRGVWMQATELRRTAENFRRDTLTGTRELSDIAEAAYRAGEGDILELLDAYRAELDAELMGLDLELRARLARIELDLLSGATTHE